MKQRRTLLVLLIAAAPLGCAAAPATHAGLDATLWVQTSAEYRSVATQAYAAAEAVLPEAVGDSTWTAALEQDSGFSGLPPAVILDVDETVLDNSPYQARLVASDSRYGADSWAEWVRQEAAESVPGALDFARAARALGVTVFYITNRAASLEGATRANLGRLGFPLDTTVDVVLTVGEREEWGSDKESRRAHVAARYRVVMLVGDDLGDFVSGARSAPADRIALAERYREHWGSRWFVLPNPTYGGWERALYGFDAGLPAADILQEKYGRLDPRTPAER